MRRPLVAVDRDAGLVPGPIRKPCFGPTNGQRQGDKRGPEAKSLSDTSRPT